MVPFFLFFMIKYTYYGNLINKKEFLRKLINHFKDKKYPNDIYEFTFSEVNLLSLNNISNEEYPISNKDKALINNKDIKLYTTTITYRNKNYLVYGLAIKEADIYIENDELIYYVEPIINDPYPVVARSEEVSKSVKYASIFFFMMILIGLPLAIIMLNKDVIVSIVFFAISIISLLFVIGFIIINYRKKIDQDKLRSDLLLREINKKNADLALLLAKIEEIKD